MAIKHDLYQYMLHLAFIHSHFKVSEKTEKSLSNSVSWGHLPNGGDQTEENMKLVYSCEEEALKEVTAS